MQTSITNIQKPNIENKTWLARFDQSVSGAALRSASGFESVRCTQPLACDCDANSLSVRKVVLSVVAVSLLCCWSTATVSCLSERRIE